MDDKVFEKTVDRRSFLRGSALFAAAIGLGVAASPAFAQQTQEPQQPKPEDEKKKEEQPPSDNGSGQNETLVDADGREYRVCPQCASNMYRQGRTWTCENCGYSYVE